MPPKSRMCKRWKRTISQALAYVLSQVAPAYSSSSSFTCSGVTSRCFHTWDTTFVTEDLQQQIHLPAGPLAAAVRFVFLRYHATVSTKFATFPCVSRKLAVATWSLLFPPPHPNLPGHFEAMLEADGHGLKSCQGSRQSVFSISKSHQNPVMFPGSYEP